jgi:hypothetical protein
MCCPSDNGQQTVQSVTMTPEGQQYANKALSAIGRAETESLNPYTAYPHSRIAGFTPDQTAGFDATRANAGVWQPGLTSAYQYTQQAGQQLPQYDVNQYMNPFTQNVTDIAKREATRQDDIARQQRDAGAVGAGSFGGTRHALVEAEAGRNLGQRLNDIQMTGDMAAYQSALAQINADRNAALAAGGQSARLGQLESGLGYTDAAAMQDIGGVQQQQEQRSLDTAYQDFITQRDWGKGQLSFLNSILRGSSPQQFGQTTTTTAPSPSTLGQLGGLGLSAAGMIGGTGGFGSSGWLTKLLFKKGGLVPNVRKYADGGLTGISLNELRLLQRDYMRARDPRLQAISTEIARREGRIAGSMEGPGATGLSSLLDRTRAIGAQRESELQGALPLTDRDLEGIRGRYPAPPQVPAIRPAGEAPIRTGVPGEQMGDPENIEGSHWNPEMNRTPLVNTGAAGVPQDSAGLEATPQADAMTVDPSMPMSPQDVDAEMSAGDPSATATPDAATVAAAKQMGVSPWELMAVAGLRMMEAGSKPGATALGALGSGGLEAVKYMQANRALGQKDRTIDLEAENIKRRTEADKAEARYRDRKNELDTMLAENKISAQKYENDKNAAYAEYLRTAKTDEARARIERQEAIAADRAQKQQDTVDRNAAVLHQGRTKFLDDPEKSFMIDPKDRDRLRTEAEMDVIRAYPRSNLAREFKIKHYGIKRSNILRAKTMPGSKDPITDAQRAELLEQLEKEYASVLKE